MMKKLMKLMYASHLTEIVIFDDAIKMLPYEGSAVPGTVIQE